MRPRRSGGVAERGRGRREGSVEVRFLAPLLHLGGRGAENRCLHLQKRWLGAGRGSQRLLLHPHLPQVHQLRLQCRAGVRGDGESKLFTAGRGLNIKIYRYRPRLSRSS